MNGKKGDPQSGEFLGSEPEFAEPMAHPAGAMRCVASQRNRCLTPITHLAVLGADGNFRNLSAAQPSDI